MGGAKILQGFLSSDPHKTKTTEPDSTSWGAWDHPTPHPTPAAADGMAGKFPESTQDGSAFLGAFKDPDLVLWTKGFPGNFSNFPSPTSQPLDQQGCR